MACLSGDYTKGVAILSELFVDTKDPTYLFNQGRCFEQNRRYDDAIARASLKESWMRRTGPRPKSTSRIAKIGFPTNRARPKRQRPSRLFRPPLRLRP